MMISLDFGAFCNTHRWIRSIINHFTLFTCVFGECTPKSNDLAPKSNDLAPKSNDLAPKSNDLAPKSNDLAPKSNGFSA